MPDAFLHEVEPSSRKLFLPPMHRHVVAVKGDVVDAFAVGGEEVGHYGRGAAAVVVGDGLHDLPYQRVLLGEADFEGEEGWRAAVVLLAYVGRGEGVDLERADAQAQEAVDCAAVVVRYDADFYEVA